MLVLSYSKRMLSYICFEDSKATPAVFTPTGKGQHHLLWLWPLLWRYEVSQVLGTKDSTLCNHRSRASGLSACG